MRTRIRRNFLAITVAAVASFGSACAASYHDLATASIEEEQYDAAVDYLEKGAIEGDKRCDYLLATLMLSGDLEGESDLEAAREWLRGAAIAGVPEAQSDMGKLFESGTGVERDMLKAAEWYRKAADAGVAEAQANLGLLYETGQGVEADPAQAVVWYQKAAEQGHPLGQGAFGLALFQGAGVPKDVVGGYMWTMLALEQQDATAESNLRAMASQMTVAQRASARRKASAFREGLVKERKRKVRRTDLQHLKTKMAHQERGERRSQNRRSR